VLSQGIDQAPLNAQLHLWRGNTYWAICDYRNAIKDFDTAISQNDDSADAYAHKAVCQARLGFYDGAVGTFRLAAKRKTSDSTVMLLISRALFEYKDYQAAIDYLKDFDEKQTGRPAILSNILLTRAQSQAALGQIDVAIQDVNKVMTVQPAFYLAYVARARIYQKQEQYEKALADVKKAMELHKAKFPLAHLIAGECQLALGNLAEADREIGLAISESGRLASGEAQHYKALITERKGNFLGSLTERAMALQLGYADPPALTILGREVLSVDQVFNAFPSIVVSDHFVCYSDLSKEKLERYSRLVEGFANYVSTNVCNLQGEYPALLFILHDKASEQYFLKDRMDFTRGVHGVFITDKNSVVTYDGAGVGTLLHEVMHKFLYNTKAHDFWADEGIPSFFERFYGYLYKDGQDAPQNLFLQTGYPDAGSQFWMRITKRTLKLSQIVSSARYADPGNEDAQRLVALFLNSQHKLKRFLELTFNASRGKYKYFIEAVFDKPLSELNPLFDDYLASLNKNQETLDKLPPSEIFDSKEDFDQFVKAHYILAPQVKPFSAKIRCFDGGT